MKIYHKLTQVRFDDADLVLQIDGREARFSLERISDKLASASDEQRSNYEISPSGYGISWPLIDEDLSIDALLGIVHSPRMNKKSA